MEAKYEIQVHGSWVTVNDWIFRSWGGARRLNGQDFTGPVYYLGSDKVAPPPPAPFASKRARRRAS